MNAVSRQMSKWDSHYIKFILRNAYREESVMDEHFREDLDSIKGIFRGCGCPDVGIGVAHARVAPEQAR
jgi:hypothetical protein